MAKEKNFEQELEKLEKIIAGLESGNVSLEELVKRYEEGAALLKSCREKLAGAELRIQRLKDVDDRGNALSEDFDDTVKK